MSKTIELKFEEWNIAYSVEPFEVIDYQKFHYQASILYSGVHISKRFTDTDRKNFETFEECKAWIDEQLPIEHVQEGNKK